MKMFTSRPSEPPKKTARWRPENPPRRPPSGSRSSSLARPRRRPFRTNPRFRSSNRGRNRTETVRRQTRTCPARSATSRFEFRLTCESLVEDGSRKHEDEWRQRLDGCFKVAWSRSRTDFSATVANLTVRKPIPQTKPVRDSSQDTKRRKEGEKGPSHKRTGPVQWA